MTKRNAPFLVTHSETLDAAVFSQTGSFVAWVEDWDKATRFYTAGAALWVADHAANLPGQWHVVEELDAITATINMRDGTVTQR